MDHVERKEFKVVAVIEPGAFEMVERQSAQPAERQGIYGELFDGFHTFGIRLEIEDVDQTVADLEDVDVAGERFPGFEFDGNVEVEPPLEVFDVGKLEEYWHLNRHGYGIVHQHEFLERLVAELVLGHRLQNEPRGLHRGVGGFGSDPDFIEVEEVFVLGTAVLFLGRFAEQFVRAEHGDGFQKEFEKRPERPVRPVLVNQEIKFGAVAFVIINLPVEQAGFEKDFPRVVSRHDGISQPENREILAVISQPVGNGLRSDLEAVGSGNELGRVFKRIKPVVKCQAVEDDSQGIRAVFADERSESPAAPIAEIDLDGFVFFLSRSFLDDLAAMAIGTVNHRFVFRQWWCVRCRRVRGEWFCHRI